MRCWTLILAGLCATSSCSLLFEASSDVEQRRDSGTRIDGAFGTLDAREKTLDARQPEIWVDELTSDTFTRSPYVLESLAGAPENTGVVFVVTQGIEPASVLATNDAETMVLAPVAQTENKTLAVYAYVVPAFGGSRDIEVFFDPQDIELNVMMAAVTVEGAASYEAAGMIPGSGGLPAEAMNLEDGELAVYSVACLGDNVWAPNPRRLWELKLEGVFNSTGLVGVVDETLDPQLESNGICDSASAVGVVFSP